MEKTKKILLRVGVGVLSFVAIMLLVLAIVMNTVVTPKRITPILLKLSHEYINGEVQCESVDITFFSTFPDLGIKLQNGSVSSQTDTLVTFGNCIITFDPMAFIFGKKVVLRQFEIDNADIYAHVDSLGKANWDIFISSEEEVIPQDSVQTAFEMPELNINNIRLRNINLIYDDLQQDMLVMVDTLNLRLEGNLSKEQAALNLGMRTSGITYYSKGQTFSRNVPVSFNTRLKRDRVLKTLAIERGRLRVGSLELKTNGLLSQSDSAGVAKVDVDFSLNASSLADLVNMVPTHISDVSTKLVAGGKIESSGKIAGLLSKNHYPVITFSSQLIDGTLASTKQADKPFLEDLDIDLNGLVDLTGEQASSVVLNKLYLQTASSKLNGKGRFDNILDKPFINAEAKADINFTQMAQKLPLDGMKMEGQVHFDLSAQCLLDDVLLSNFGKVNVNGEATIKNVKFNHQEENFTFYTSNADLTFGSNTQDSVRGRVLESLLRARIALDSLNLNWKDELMANAGRLSAMVSTSAPKDTSSIAPVMTAIRANNMRLVMGDSVRVRAVQTTGSVRLQSQADKPGLPEMAVRFSLDTIMGRVYEIGGRVSKANLNLKLIKLPSRQRNRGTVTPRVQRDSTTLAVADTAQVRRSGLTRAQRDSLRNSRLDPTTNLSFQVESQDTKKMLREWEATGGFSSQDMSLRTPLFPIPIRMRESDITFTSSNLLLEKAHLLIGHSDFTLKGEVNGIKQALLSNGKISAKMMLDADSLDFNELIRAAVAGSEYSRKNIVEKDSISGSVLDESNEITLDTDTTQMGVFVVPRNLDLVFNSRIKNAKFNDITINYMRGGILLRDQALQFPRFTMDTDIGSASMSMVYKAPDTKGAHLGMELNVKRIDVGELINAFPMINELTPMLRSFEGVVDCELTAVTELDSLMNVRLPQTTMSCYLSGQDLVLLDGETFAEISKMLMFKNKNRNVIDSMSVEMILEDEKLMIFPFQLVMDRYNAAVGGVQNLDTSFDYHITVLKSPIPFKLGLNISGTPDKMKIRLGKAKYKDMFTVAREKDLDHTVINLRKEMDEKLRKSISEIVGMDMARPIRRPRVEMPDSLKHSYFQLEDTTEINHP